ncbi:hypothetical protein L596_025316 [Steinernema carpocapsae]|uniref:Uncharacterized protein n=1 Tax=Steinernema carpocapsae TaxID=34508 RepID=A0A4U5M7F7_STECR|nr:hypothetical protein L596_025316 [Steinernema carpocapsae]
MHNVPFIFREEVVGLLPSPRFGISRRFDFDAIPDDLWRTALEESWKKRPTLWTTLYRRDGEWYYDITHYDPLINGTIHHLPMAVDPSIEELKKSDLRFLRFCHLSADDEYFRRFTPILIALLLIICLQSRDSLSSPVHLYLIQECPLLTRV